MSLEDVSLEKELIRKTKRISGVSGSTDLEREEKKELIVLINSKNSSQQGRGNLTRCIGNCYWVGFMSLHSAELLENNLRKYLEN